MVMSNLVSLEKAPLERLLDLGEAALREAVAWYRDRGVGRGKVDAELECLVKRRALERCSAGELLARFERGEEEYWPKAIGSLPLTLFSALVMVLRQAIADEERKPADFANLLDLIFEKNYLTEGLFEISRLLEEKEPITVTLDWLESQKPEAAVTLLARDLWVALESAFESWSQVTDLVFNHQLWFSASDPPESEALLEKFRHLSDRAILDGSPHGVRVYLDEIETLRELGNTELTRALDSERVATIEDELWIQQLFVEASE